MTIAVKRIQLAIDVQLVVTDEGGGVVDLRLHRRSPAEVGQEGFMPTAAGFRLPLDRVEDLVKALEHIRGQTGAQVDCP